STDELAPPRHFQIRRSTGEVIGGVMIATSYPISLGVSSIEDRILQSTMSKPATIPGAQARAAEIKVIEGLTVGFTVLALALAGGVVAYCSEGRRKTETI